MILDIAVALFIASPALIIIGFIVIAIIEALKDK